MPTHCRKAPRTTADAKGVPELAKEKQTFTIFNDARYELVIEKLNPAHNPARDAFRQEKQLQSWELHKLVCADGAITAYDGSGAVLFSYANSRDRDYFRKLADKIKADPYFASHVNIGAALFKVSAGAQNYRDPEVRKFFVSPDAEVEKQDRFVLLKQNVSSLMHTWSANTQPQPHHDGGRVQDDNTSPDASASTPEEIMAQMHDNMNAALAQRNPADVLVVTAIDTTAQAVDAEVAMTYAGQVLRTTTYSRANDEAQTIQVAYTEVHETDPVYDVDFITVESVVYTDVSIVNNAK